MLPFKFRGHKIQNFTLGQFIHGAPWAQQIPTPDKKDTTKSSKVYYATEDSLKNGFFDSEKIVITGGAEGLGRTLAIKLSKLSATIALWDNNQKNLEETENLVKAVGGKIHTYVCDLGSREDIYKCAEKTKKDIGLVTMLINNADVASGKLLLDTPDKLIEKTFNVNVLSHFWMVKAFLPNMIDANSGHIVTISSMAGHMGVQKLTDYCATKSAVLGFMSALRTELEREGTNGIKITTICPYFMSSTNNRSNADLRFISSVTPDTVADRTITAIAEKEFMVFIPGWFKFTSVPRWLMPWSFSSILKRIIIKDPYPSTTVKEEPINISTLKKATEQVGLNSEQTQTSKMKPTSLESPNFEPAKLQLEPTKLEVSKLEPTFESEFHVSVSKIDSAQIKKT